MHVQACLQYVCVCVCVCVWRQHQTRVEGTASRAGQQPGVNQKRQALLLSWATVALLWEDLDIPLHPAIYLNFTLRWKPLNAHTHTHTHIQTTTFKLIMVAEWGLV